MTEPNDPGVKLGKKPPRHDPRTLALATYLVPGPALPAVPPSIEPPAATWPMYGNDVHADCTCAAAGHLVVGWSTEERKQHLPTDADVLALYGLVNGGEDQGAVAIDVLNVWRQQGLGGDRIAAYVALDRGSEEMLRHAVAWFGGIYAGFALPRSVQGKTIWEGPGPNGVQGDAGIGSWGGHAVSVHGYDQRGLYVCTWGQIVPVTWEFWHTYAEEAFAVYDALDWLGDVPGLDAAALTADLAKLTGGGA